ncbi:MAG: LamB/YcsF family protein [Chitinophagaceae bacterium]|nr:LamB/YcsF family protein [Chitinophagaceae bacterium]
MREEKKDTPAFKNSSKASPEGGGLEGAIDINCDMGEGIGNDDLIMPFISSASIACGYHAGDEKTMWETIELAKKHNVAIGAHVSFLDKENFGRKEMKWERQGIYNMVIQQLVIINVIADDLKIGHVKPHGALYNMSARDKALANTIAAAIKDFDESLVVFGLSGSHSIAEAKAIGLKTASEVFADRTYQDNGSLTPRNQPNALINDTSKAVEQVLQMINDGTVTTVSGKKIPILAETICIHGDGEHAVKFARAIHDAIKKV